MGRLGGREARVRLHLLRLQRVGVRLERAAHCDVLLAAPVRLQPAVLSGVLGRENVTRRFTDRLRVHANLIADVRCADSSSVDSDGSAHCGHHRRLQAARRANHPTLAVRNAALDAVRWVLHHRSCHSVRRPTVSLSLWRPPGTHLHGVHHYLRGSGYQIVACLLRVRALGHEARQGDTVPYPQDPLHLLRWRHHHFIAWFAADFPEPTITTEDATEFRGTVDRISCSSSSFIFTALLIFWMAILLVLELYLSFLIRNVSVESQESPWIFGSVVVVLVGCLVIMPMTYLVTMRASTFYVFLALALIICTILIMGLMLVPKLFRLKEAAMSSTSGASSANSIKRTSLGPVPTTNLTNLADHPSEFPSQSSRDASQKYQVRPLPNANNNKFSTVNDEVTSTTNGA